jgi:hypothetical protein
MWRYADRNFDKSLKNSGKFYSLVKRCLALPFLVLTELQPVVDQLKMCEMEDEDTNVDRDAFLSYIQETWISGIYSPDMWSCFGRRSDNTNNAQESYNANFNR